ncbi:hypothetical protein [Maridesulfovibrio bastinii]|uniref:hypothetical protein n=1 Tax=Maridesulfovibrio bastinii TaxID=47157 RepID=UPI00041A3490|nr:hypothetical protein [Maridesulfovibrio bastinii]
MKDDLKEYYKLKATDDLVKIVINGLDLYFPEADESPQLSEFKHYLFVNFHDKQ